MMIKLCSYVSAFKETIVFVCDRNVDANGIYRRFLKEKSSFYPALKATRNSKSTMKDVSYYIFTVEMKYRVGRANLGIIGYETDKEAERVSKLLFTKDMPDYVKVYLAHNYLATTVLYSEKKERNVVHNNYIHSAYGALVLKDCVCQGYAEAFKRLMDKAGVKCEVVSGQVRGSSEYHAWNIVALGTPEKYFHVDVTWDSDCYKVLYKYFCVTDAHMREKRIWDEHMGITCTCTDDILNRARAYVNSNKEKLLMRGINKEVIDFNGRN